MYYFHGYCLKCTLKIAGDLLYSSAKTVLDQLRGKIVPGTVIVFDEYFNYPGWQQHEYRAFMEFTEMHRIRFEYIGYCKNGPHVAVRIQ